MTKENKVFCFPELKILKVINDKDLDKIIGKAYGKYLIEEELVVNKLGYKIKKIFFVSRGGEQNKCEKISSVESLLLLNKINNILKEFHNYHYTAFINDANSDILNFSKLFENTESYLLNIRNHEVSYDFEFL